MKDRLLDLWERIMPWKIVRRYEFNELVRDYQLLRQDYWTTTMYQTDLTAENLALREELARVKPKRADNGRFV